MDYFYINKHGKKTVKRMLLCLRFQFKMRNIRKSYTLIFGYLVLIFGFLYLSGLYQYLLAQSFSQYYIHWGPHHSLHSIISQIQEDKELAIKPINGYKYSYTYTHHEKCISKDPIRLAFIVKSAFQNFDKRDAIRNSWGYESRFSDVSIRTVFLLGTRPEVAELQTKLEKEANTHKDIVQGDFIDSYYNNTIKSMMALHWTFHYCKNTKYFLFADDDYYVSTRNLLRFLRSPSTYPHYLEKYVVSAMNEYQDYLYAGFVFPNSSPIRWYFSKWYVSLQEYPYSHWPPYITGGAFVLSNKSLINLYYASLYTSHFRFDDIFLAMAAKKGGLQPFHHPEFLFDRKPYSLESYKWVIASHGFGDPKELLEVWNEQRSAGNA